MLHCLKLGNSDIILGRLLSVVVTDMDHKCTHCLWVSQVMNMHP